MKKRKRRKNKTQLKATEYLDEEQFRYAQEILVRRAAGGGYRAAVNLFLFQFLFFTGLRREEASLINLCDLPAYHGKSGVEVRWYTSKSSRDGFVLIGENARETIKNYVERFRKDKPPSSPLFVNERGGRMSAKSIYRRIKTIGKYVGCDYLSPHRLRHSLGTDTYGRTGDLKFVQQQLRHVSSRTAEIYVHTASFGAKKKVFETDINKCKAIYRPSGRALEYSPLALNLYTGCAHGCKYCYSPRCLRMDKATFHSTVTVRPDILRKLTWDINNIKITEPVLLCFTCDPYTPEVKGLAVSFPRTAYMQQTLSAFPGITLPVGLDGGDPDNLTTRKALEYLSMGKVNFQILTKSASACRDFDLYKPGDKFAVTLTFWDEAKSKEVEPKASLPADRIKCLKLAKSEGIEMWVSLEPALDESEIHKLIDKSATYTDLYKVGKVSGYSGNITDWSGFVKRITEHFDQLGKSYFLKKDLKAYVNQHT